PRCADGCDRRRRCVLLKLQDRWSAARQEPPVQPQRGLAAVNRLPRTRPGVHHDGTESLGRVLVRRGDLAEWRLEKWRVVVLQSLPPRPKMSSVFPPGSLPHLRRLPFSPVASDIPSPDILLVIMKSS